MGCDVHDIRTQQRLSRFAVSNRHLAQVSASAVLSGSLRRVVDFRQDSLLQVVDIRQEYARACETRGYNDRAFDAPNSLLRDQASALSAYRGTSLIRNCAPA